MEKKIKIDDKTYTLIKKLAKDKNMTINQLIIRLLEFGLFKEMKNNE